MSDRIVIKPLLATLAAGKVEVRMLQFVTVFGTVTFVNWPGKVVEGQFVTKLQFFG